MRKNVKRQFFGKKTKENLLLKTRKTGVENNKIFNVFIKV
jgi:hypothetical protein